MARFANSGTGNDSESNDSRREEAEQILSRLVDISLMSEKDAEFVEGIQDRILRFGQRAFISIDQLDWLRDVDERY